MKKSFLRMKKSFPGWKRFLLKHRGMKNEMMKFFPNLEFSLSQIIFKTKKFFFLKKYIFKFHLQIFGKPQNFMISFFIPLGLNGVVLGENLASLVFFPTPTFVMKKSVLTFISSGNEISNSQPPFSRPIPRR